MDESSLQDIFTLAGGLLSWASRLQLMVYLSITEVEHVSATEGNKDVIC